MKKARKCLPPTLPLDASSSMDWLFVTRFTSFPVKRPYLHYVSVRTTASGSKNSVTVVSSLVKSFGRSIADPIYYYYFSLGPLESFSLFLNPSAAGRRQWPTLLIGQNSTCLFPFFLLVLIDVNFCCCYISFFKVTDDAAQV